jgi:enoyl-CoA hydratase/carnithine racemase
LLFSGRRIACAEALTMGLIDRLVEAALLEATVSAYASELAELSQHSIKGAKMAI